MTLSQYIEAAGVPTAFLQNYPFPAFVLSICDSPTSTPTVERSAPFTLNLHSGGDKAYTQSAAIEVVWRNSRWDRLTQQRNLADIISPDSLDRLARWVQRSSDAEDGKGKDEAEVDTFQLEMQLGPPHSVILPLACSAISSSSSASVDTLFIVTALSSGRAVEVPERPAPTPVQSTSLSPSLSRSVSRYSSISSIPSPGPGSALPSPPLATVPRSLDCRFLLDTMDWSQTSLGPRKSWSPVVETMIAVVFASPTQDSLWLGSDFNMIYNQHYTQIVDHPTMFGKSAKAPQAWGPVWESVYHLIERCLTLGEPTYKENDLLLYRRGPRGQYVERYHTWSFIPLFSPDGVPLGLYNPTSETTEAVLARRRQETMRDLSEELLVARDQKDYFASVAEVLGRNPKDVPFMIAYSVNVSSERGTDVSLRLESTIGVPDKHAAAPREMRLDIQPSRSRSSHRGSNQLSSPALSAISSLSATTTSRVRHSRSTRSWPILTALSTRQCVLVEDCSALIAGFPVRQWDDLPYQAMVIPICSEMSAETPRSVIILGLNERCPLDEAYEDWIHVLRAHLVSALASARATEAEQQRIKDMDRMARAKTAFFQNAAHELRSPLTLVAGPIDDLSRTTLTHDQRQTLNMAQRNLARIQRLVNALLDFSRLEAGKLSGHFVPVDLGRFVADLAILFKPGLDRRKIRYDIDIEPREENVFIDPTLFETVISNLVSNAVKYTAEGHVRVSVSFSAEEATISVEDTGCGIPSTEIDCIAERFNRATNVATSAVEGTGIGLAFTKEIIRLHNGEILITSKTAEETGGPHGSTFTVKLPLAARESEIGTSGTVFGAYGRQMVDEVLHWAGTGQSESSCEQDAQSVGAVSEGTKGESMLFFDRSDVLLLVDDNVELRTYIKSIFTPYCTVVEASNGIEALSYAKSNSVQLILSDLMMPKMTGDELLSAIRADSATKTIPMVLLSAATDDELRLAAIVAGATDFIMKPFKPKELLARIHLHMQLGKRRTQLEQLFLQREQEIKLLSDYCPSGIIRTDPQGVMTYGNAAWKVHAGMSDQDDILAWPQYVDPAELERLGHEWNEIVDGDAVEMTLRWKWANGKSATGTFIRLDKIDSSMGGVIGCIQDTSYQEERIRDAEQRSKELEEQKRQQDLLVDFVSHEIRTPVSAILQCSSLVKQNLEVLREGFAKAGPEGFRPTQEIVDDLAQDLDALESIYQCGLTQERIASDILSLARLQLDMLTFTYTETDLRSSAKKVVSVFSSEAKTKDIDLVLEFGKTLDITGISTIKTDHVRLGQVITNLVSNAMKFTADSFRRQITVRYEVSLVAPHSDDCDMPTEALLQTKRDMQEGDPVWLFVAVRDSGPGLSEEEQGLLFQRFSQGNRMVHSRYGGSGLGLYICKRISELLGGRIQVRSVIGQGSTFTFYIKAGYVPSGNLRHTLSDSNISQSMYGTAAPKRKLSADVTLPSLNGASRSENAAEASTMVAAENGIARNGPTQTKRRVLVVEDNLINQTVLKRQMVKAGWACDVASHGQEAIDRLEREKVEGRVYDVVLMDLEMPVMDGLTAISRIRQAENDQSTPREERQLVMALTGNARQGQIDQAFAAGMDDVVIKPYKLSELLEKLSAAVDSRRTPRQA